MSFEPLIGPVSAPELHVMTFNVRRRIRGLPQRPADRWARRRDAVATLLSAERPTLIGVQEAVPEQAAAILDALGGAYRFIGRGHGRQERGEGCPLFFDSDRLRLLDWRQTALSGTPEVPGSRSWGNLVPRILVTATFVDLRTSAEFVALNTHLDHLSSRSRVRAAEAIREAVAHVSLPAIVTGDFNAGTGSPAYRTLLEGDELTDAWVTASDLLTAESGTFGGFRAPREGGRRIDWIAVTPGVHVDRVGIDARPVDGRWPSDHVPVHAVVRVPTS